MKRLLIICAIGLTQASYALFGFGSPVTQVSDEAAPLIKQAHQIDAALEKQGVTPAQLKRYQQSINDLRSKLDDVYIKANSLLARTLPSFVNDTKKLADDLGKLALSPDGVYPYLQKKLMPNSAPGTIKKLSTDELKKRITDYRTKLNDRSDDSKKMREILLIFITDYTREVFDAFLEGDNALKKLMITDKKQIEQLQDLCVAKIPAAQQALDAAQKKIEELLQ